MEVTWEGISLTAKQREILAHIACNGPKNEYRLGKECNVSGYTAHTVPRDLEEKGLLTAIDRGKARTGRTIREFHLTTRGLLTTLLLHRGLLWEKIEEVMEHWSHLLPLILGKWSYFKKRGLETFLKYRVEGGLFSEFTDLHPAGTPRFPFPPPDPKERFTLIVLSPSLPLIQAAVSGVKVEAAASEPPLPEETLRLIERVPAEKLHGTILERFRGKSRTEMAEELRMGREGLELQVRWMEALRDDPELCIWLTEQIQRMRNRGKMWENAMRAFTAFLKEGH